MNFFFIIFFALFGALAMANPIDNTVPAGNATVPDVVNIQSTQTTCDDCNAYFKICYSGILCWLNPGSYLQGCQRETCRAHNGYCKENCGWGSFC